MKMESKSILYLSRQDVEGVGLSMQEIILALEAMFKEKGEGRYEMPPKPGIHPREEAFIHAMPAYLSPCENTTLILLAIEISVPWRSVLPGR